MLSRSVTGKIAAATGGKSVFSKVQTRPLRLKNDKNLPISTRLRAAPAAPDNSDPS